jgi:hypothetical protein
MSTRIRGHRQIENQAKHARLKVAKVQFGVWYRNPDALPDQGRSFSIEYERDFPRNGAAYIQIAHELGLFRISVSGKFRPTANAAELSLFRPSSKGVKKYGISFP